MNRTIQPFVGIGDFTLLSPEKAVIETLKKNHVPFTKEIWDNSECTVKVPWSIIRAEDSMSFFFANDKLFKIFVCDGFEGSLSNEISIGTNIEDAKTIDPTLKYDDWNEDWSSDCGYWLEDSPESNKVISITIFIKELLDDDLFEEYKW